MEGDRGFMAEAMGMGRHIATHWGKVGRHGAHHEGMEIMAWMTEDTGAWKPSMRAGMERAMSVPPGLETRGEVSRLPFCSALQSCSNISRREGGGGCDKLLKQYATCTLRGQTPPTNSNIS